MTIKISVLIINDDSLYIKGTIIIDINIMVEIITIIIKIIDIMLLNFLRKKHFKGYKKYASINDIKKGNSGFIILLSTTSHNGYILYIVSIIKHINNTFINFSI